MRTELRIVSTLVGTYWWPSGVEWLKPVDRTFVVNRNPVHSVNEVSSIREAAERVTDDGDSQAAARLSLVGFIELTRWSPSGNRRVTRRFPLETFRSLDDYLAGEDEELLECADLAGTIDDVLEDADPVVARDDPLTNRRTAAVQVFAEARLRRAGDRS